MSKQYHDEISDIYNDKLKALLKTLPDYCKYYFNAKAQSFEPRTGYAYAVDMRTFYEFIISTKPSYQGKSIKDVPISLFDELTSHDIDEYLNYLKKYSFEGDHRKNSESGRKRKFIALRSFCKYYLEKGYIKKNPTELMPTPKVHKDDTISYLTKEEKEQLFFAIKSSYGMTPWQETLNAYCRKRDIAILMLLLGTGIRVSELVGLNIEDIDFKENVVHIIRKGGNAGHVYFNEQVKDAILSYLRPSIVPVGTRDGLGAPPEERALFISLKKKRLSVRSVQKIIEKYKTLAFGPEITKKISPHTMRKTYGTELYLEKNDIKLVSDTLGHKSITTTQQYYASTTEEKRKTAAIKVL